MGRFVPVGLHKWGLIIVLRECEEPWAVVPVCGHACASAGNRADNSYAGGEKQTVHERCLSNGWGNIQSFGNNCRDCAAPRYKMHFKSISKWHSIGRSFEFVIDHPPHHPRRHHRKQRAELCKAPGFDARIIGFGIAAGGLDDHFRRSVSTHSF